MPSSIRTRFQLCQIRVVALLLYIGCLPVGFPVAAAAVAEKSQFPSAESIDFSAAQIPSQKHPFLFVTRQDIAQAHRRVAQKKYRGAAASLNTKADEALHKMPESIDASWWDDVRDKPWSDTYPIIYQKTCLEPLRMMLPAHHAALRYTVTKSRQDLAAAKEILLCLSDYSFKFEHYDVGMNYAVWGHSALNTYDILFPHFDDAERARLDEFFTRMGRAILRNDIYWIENDIGGGINNHLAWHKMMLGCLGVFYGRNDLVEYAVHGRRGVLPLLDVGLIDDGLWCESSLNYHFTAIVPMVYLAEALRNTGHGEDLYKTTTAGGRNIRQAYDAMFGVLFPDGSIPPIGDAYARRIRLCDEFTYVYAHKAYKDPRYAWLVENADLKGPELVFIGIDTKAPKPPQISSRLYPEHGYVFLRDGRDEDYWNSDAWCAFLTFDKSGVHCHQDKLSLMLFGCGKLLLPDVEARATVPHAFSSRVQQQLNRSGLSQNTVMVDYRDQRGIPEVLTLVEFRDTPNEKSATAADHKGLLYEGVRQSRTVCVKPEYVLDVFQVAADSEHDIAWIVHAMGLPGSQKCSIPLRPAEVAQATPAVEIPGPGSYLRDLRTATTDNAIHMEWSEDRPAGEGSVRFGMTIAAQPATKVITCGYPATDEPNCPTIPMVLLERRAASTMYAAVYQADRRALADVRIDQFENTDDRLAFQVTGPWGSRKHLIPRLRPTRPLGPLVGGPSG